MQQSLISLSFLCLVACQGKIGGQGEDGGLPVEDGGENQDGGRADVPPPVDLDTCRETHYTIFEALRPACEQCHGRDTPPTAFRTFEAFEQLLAYNDAYVVPGNPDESLLVQLLEGDGTGDSESMPPTAPYLGSEAETSRLSMASIREWVTNLQVCEVDRPPSGPVVRRMRAEQIRLSLYQQLGLSSTDFSGTETGYNSSEGIISNDRSAPTRPYRLYSPTDIPGPPHQTTSAGRDDRGYDAWADLGGADVFRGSLTTTSTSATFMQRFIPLTQAWCRRSVDDGANDALFRDIEREADVVEQVDAAKANLRYLYLRLLSIEADDTEIDELYREVLVPLSAEGSATDGWVGTCAALVRDPRWLSY